MCILVSTVTISVSFHQIKSREFYDTSFILNSHKGALENSFFEADDNILVNLSHIPIIGQPLNRN